MAIDHDDVFYLGDHPVVPQYTERPSGAGELGFDIQGVEAFLPLTPKCALYMPCLSISEQIISGYENALSIHRGLRSAALRGPTIASLHSGLLHLSQRVMRQSYPLYQALTTGVALTAISENVENLNYLQCAWAHMAVYSNRGILPLRSECSMNRRSIGQRLRHGWPWLKARWQDAHRQRSGRSLTG